MTPTLISHIFITDGTLLVQILRLYVGIHMDLTDNTNEFYRVTITMCISH